MKTYWPTRPSKRRQVGLDVLGHEGDELAHAVELPAPEQLAHGIRVADVAPQLLHAVGQRAQPRFAAVQHGHLVPELERPAHARRRDDAGTADVQDAKCSAHASILPRRVALASSRARVSVAGWMIGTAPTVPTCSRATGGRAGRRVVPEVAFERDLVVEHADSGFCGAVLGVEKGLARLEDRRGAVRVFPLGDGWLVDGDLVRAVPPAVAAAAGRRRTASGSFAVADAPARVARASRIFVEGRHDAELVERVWGDDLRVEGVVVEYLGGIDDLDGIVREFAPSRDRRIGVLVDHLVPGSKETRIADSVSRGPHGDAVLVVGHPFIDVWAAVKPARLGLDVWPDVPRSLEWKRASATPSAGRATRRPTSRGPGSASWGGCAATATSSPPCSGASSSSSTS